MIDHISMGISLCQPATDALLSRVRFIFYNPRDLPFLSLEIA